MEAIAKLYKGKKVFLTGHTGFKGSWLLKILHLLGASVKGYALNPENEFDLYHLINGDTLNSSVIADIRNREKLIQEIRSFQPDFIFHLAAQPLVRLSYEIPSATFEINAIGTANLLDAVRTIEKPCSVILITTDKVYHNKEWYYPYRENDRLGGHDPYSASKACAEMIIDSYRNSFFNSNNYAAHQKGIAVARAGNVIGGGDWSKDRLLPDICRALGNSERITIRNPDAVRPWQHVMEPLLGYLLLGAKLYNNPTAFSQAYNFGPHAEDTLSVEQMVKLAIEKWGNGKYEKTALTTQPHEANLLKLDISKAAAELQWKPSMNTADAVTKTIEWYRIFFNDKTQIPGFVEQQIKSFMMG